MMRSSLSIDKILEEMRNLRNKNPKPKIKEVIANKYNKQKLK